MLVWMLCVGAGVGGWRDAGCAAKLQIGSPRLTLKAPGFCEVIDMQITRVHVRIFPGGVASRHSVNTIMEMRRGFFGSHCLSWITRLSNEPVSTATVTEWGVWIVRHRITVYGRRERQGEEEGTSDQSPPLPHPCLLHLPKQTCANTFCVSFYAPTSFLGCQSFCLSSLIAYQNQHHAAVWIHHMLA